MNDRRVARHGLVTFPCLSSCGLKDALVLSSDALCPMRDSIRRQFCASFVRGRQSIKRRGREHTRAPPHADPVFGQILYENANAVDRLLRHRQDLAEGIALALDANGSVLSSLYVLQRALGEAIVRIPYIFDASVAPARVIARLDADHIETVEGDLRAAEALARAGQEDAQRTSAISRRCTGPKEGGFELRCDSRRPPLTVSVLMTRSAKISGSMRPLLIGDLFPEARGNGSSGPVSPTVELIALKHFASLESEARG